MAVVLRFCGMEMNSRQHLLLSPPSRIQGYVGAILEPGKLLALNGNLSDVKLMMGGNLAFGRVTEFNGESAGCWRDFSRYKTIDPLPREL